MERTILLRLAFDGTAFHGWQEQLDQRTVQGVLREQIQRVVRHPLALLGSGRTDAGVHAVAYVASFRTHTTLDADRLMHAIGSRLPDDIAILEAMDVHPDFHATQSAISKLYRYRIFNSPVHPVSRLIQREVWHIWHPLNYLRMREAATSFIGEHDFTSMTPVATKRLSMVRNVIRCDVERHKQEIRIDVEGDGFLHNQVRTMVGTLMGVGTGRFSVEDVAAMLEARDRTKAGQTAPALGLCLRWVKYPEKLLVPVKPIATEND